MNCIIVDDDDFARKELEFMIRQTVFLNLVGSYTNAMDATQSLLDHHVDIIFLDVVMPEMDGIEFVQSLSIQKPEIIFVTGYTEYALDAFNYDVTDFLVKPVDYKRFLKAVSKAKRNHTKKKDRVNTLHDHIFIKVSSKLIKIDVKDICYIEAMADYITIYAEKDRYTILSTMKNMESLLAGNHFFRVHNSYIVNLKKITSIEDNTIQIGDTLIPVSRNRLKELLNQLKLI